MAHSLDPAHEVPVDKVVVSVGHISFSLSQPGMPQKGPIVQGVKDKKKLLASDLYQSMKICKHG